MHTLKETPPPLIPAIFDKYVRNIITQIKKIEVYLKDVTNFCIERKPRFTDTIVVVM